MTQFGENNGKARWVTSPILSKSDWESLITGDQAREDVLTDIPVKVSVLLNN